MPAKGENKANEVQKFMWRLGGECDRIGRRKFGVIERNDFEENERVLVAMCDGNIVGFCTYANKDELPSEYEFTPFVGFMFVDEIYRGNRISERLINCACGLALKQGFSKMYIMSGEIGLYEKYGFTKIGDYKTIYDSIDQLFYKDI